MRKAIFTLAALAAFAAGANGLLPSMVYRYGLTNEQIDGLLAKHPDAQLRLTAQDWRAMKYQLCRFDCMTNYVAMIGGTNDAARVLLDLHDRAEGLASVSNALAKAVARIGHERDEAAERANEYAEAYASATNSIAALRIYYTEATNRTAIAEARAARLDAFRAYLVEQRDNARLQTTKALYQALIDRIDAGGL